MAQTLITREMMGQVGTLTNASPGNLGNVVTGSWFTRAVGPYDGTTSAPGWSADVRAAGFQSYWDCTVSPYSNALPFGAVSFWIRFTDFSQAIAVNHFTTLLQLRTSADAFILDVGINKNGDVSCGDNNASVNFPAYLNKHIWYFLVLEFQNQAGPAKVAYKLSMTPLGGSTTVIRDRTGAFSTGGPQIGRVQLRNRPDGSTGYWDGRIGACGLHAIAAFGEGVQPPDLISPVEARHTWYLNPNTGNDNNTGLAPNLAWKTGTKLAAELLNSGVFGNVNPWKFTDGTFPAAPLNGDDFCKFNAANRLLPNGDTVLIDTTRGVLVLSAPIVIQSRAPGLLVTSAGPDRADIQAFTLISPSGWSKTAGQTNIYQTASTEPFSVLWEMAPGTPVQDFWKSLVWYNHPIGASFAGVAASMDATPGSFWTDGTNMFVHPFGSTVPGYDGKVYARSLSLGNTANSALIVSGGDCTLSRLKIGGTAIVDSAKQDFPPNTNHYCIQLVSNNNKVSDCYCYYGAKHIVGILDGSSTKGAFIELTDAEQGSIYTGGGGQIPFITYSFVSTGMVAYWKNCTCLQNEGIVGQTSGTIDCLDPAWHTHNNGTGQQWSNVYVDSCNFPGNVMSQVNNAVVGGITITNSRMGACSLDYANIDGCFFDIIGAVPNAGGNVTITNTIFRPTINPAASVLKVQGTLTMKHCTIDMRASATLGVNAYLFRFAASNLTYQNNMFVNKPGTDTALHSGFLSTDTLVFNNNIYMLGSGGLVALSYNDGSTTANRTLAQWQALGFDAGSMAADPQLDANFRPGTKLVNIAGVELGPLDDFCGVVFQHRSGAGAYELALVVAATNNSGFDLTPRIALLALVGALSAKADNMGAKQALSNAGTAQSLNPRQLDQCLLGLLCRAGVSCNAQTLLNTSGMGGIQALFPLEVMIAEAQSACKSARGASSLLATAVSGGFDSLDNQALKLAALGILCGGNCDAKTLMANAITSGYDSFDQRELELAILGILLSGGDNQPSTPSSLLNGR